MINRWLKVLKKGRRLVTHINVEDREQIVMTRQAKGSFSVKMAVVTKDYIHVADGYYIMKEGLLRYHDLQIRRLTSTIKEGRKAADRHDVYRLSVRHGSGGYKIEKETGGRLIKGS